MDRVILDTDVSSLSLKRRLPSPVLTRVIGRQPCITFVTLGELSQWAELREWGRVSANAIKRGRPRPANDTWIAACALTYGLPLATLNAKDFKDFAEHEGLILVIAG